MYKINLTQKNNGNTTTNTNDQIEIPNIIEMPKIQIHDFSYLDIDEVFKVPNSSTLFQKFIKKIEQKYPNMKSEDVMAKLNASDGDGSNWDFRFYMNSKLLSYKPSHKMQDLIKFNATPASKISNLAKLMEVYDKEILQIKATNNKELFQQLQQNMSYYNVQKFYDSIKEEKRLMPFIRKEVTNFQKNGFSRKPLAIWKGFLRDKFLILATSGLLEIVHYVHMMEWQDDFHVALSLLNFSLDLEENLLDIIMNDRKYTKIFEWTKSTIPNQDIVSLRPKGFPIMDSSKAFELAVQNQIISQEFANKYKEIKKVPDDLLIDKLKAELENQNYSINEKIMAFLGHFITTNIKKEVYMWKYERLNKKTLNFSRFLLNVELPLQRKKEFCQIDHKAEKKIEHLRFKFKDIVNGLKLLNKFINKEFAKIEEKTWEILYLIFENGSTQTALASVFLLTSYKKEIQKQIDYKKLINLAFKIHIHDFEDASLFSKEDFLTWILWAYKTQ